MVYTAVGLVALGQQYTPSLGRCSGSWGQLTLALVSSHATRRLLWGPVLNHDWGAALTNTSAPRGGPSCCLACGPRHSYHHSDPPQAQRQEAGARSSACYGLDWIRSYSNQH